MKTILQTIKFAIKNTFRKKLVAGLSIAGITIGIALMVAMSSTTAGFDALLGDSLAETMGDVEIAEEGKSSYLSQLPENITDYIMTIESNEEIEGISPEIDVYGFNQFLDNITLHAGMPMAPVEFMQLSALGTIPTNDQIFDGPTNNIIEGKVFDADYEIIIADYILDGAPAVFVLNQEFPLQINETFAINLTVTGVFETEEGPMQILSPAFVMNINTGRLINSMSLPFEQVGYNYANIRFVVDNLDETREYAAQLEDLTINIDISLAGESIEAVSDLMETFDLMNLIMSTITIVAGGMAIVVAQLMGVNERMKEFAIMKATGWKNSTIFLDIILESMIIGIIGSLVGFGVGIGFLYIIQAAYGISFVTITWQIVVQTLAFGLGIGLAGGLLPGIRAARVKPMEVIRAA
ncbi:MAG: ABC transporter permease [Candidatus Heimdallarchaeota archaeon]